MSLSMIAAVAANGVIGRDNRLLWHISDDLQYFKKKTMGRPIIMGRKTFESLPFLLPGRPHYVLSGRSDFHAPEGVKVFRDIPSLLKELPEGENFIIGGARIYEEMLPYADTLYLTELAVPFEGDAYFPNFDKDEWILAEETVGAGEIPHRFAVYKRNEQCHKGSFLENEEEAPLEELAPGIRSKLDELAERGNQFEEEGKWEDAVQAWKAGLDLIPGPQQFYTESIWFLASMGDVYFKRGMYSLAHECFNQARGNVSGEGYENPFMMLRLGQCCLELGDEKNAAEYLLRAYMMEGKEIFDPDEDGEDDGRTYFDFLKTHVSHIE